jgi:hypothetical protein
MVTVGTLSRRRWFERWRIWQSVLISPLSETGDRDRPPMNWWVPLIAVLILLAGAFIGCGGSVAPLDASAVPTNDAGASDASFDTDTMDASTSSDVTTAEAAAEAGCQSAGDAAVTVSPFLLAFGDGGLVACGTQAPPLSATITNDTCASVGFTTELTTGMTYYSVSPASGVLGPWATQAVQVTPVPVPLDARTNGYPGTLSVTTTAAGDGVHLVSLETDAYGAIMECPEFGSVVAFGAVPVGQTGSYTLGITNVGLAPTTLSFPVSNPAFSVTTIDGGPPSAIPAVPGHTVLVMVTFTPSAAETYTGTIEMVLAPGTPQCEVPLGPAQLSGTGM